MFANWDERSAFYAENCERCTKYVPFEKFMETKQSLCPIGDLICQAIFNEKKFPYQYLTESTGPEKYRCKELKEAEK